jgi:AGCS family alanine or glycine:cation symporter
MTIPNLIGLLVLRKDIKRTITAYWSGFKKEWPKEKLPMGINKD